MDTNYFNCQTNEWKSAVLIPNIIKETKLERDLSLFRKFLQTIEYLNSIIKKKDYVVDNFYISIANIY
jgi:hypothetical protein